MTGPSKTVIILFLAFAAVVLYLSGICVLAANVSITQNEYIEVIEVVQKTDKPDKGCRMKYAGTFVVTAYNASAACCGVWADGITASGTTATEGRTIAADWSILPVGTVVYISDIGYRTVEDKGGAIDGLDIDLFMDSYSDCVQFGRQELDVWILKGE